LALAAPVEPTTTPSSSLATTPSSSLATTPSSSLATTPGSSLATTPSSSLATTPSSSLALTPSPSPTAETYPAAVRIRIPAIDVDRSIIEVPLVYDPRSKVWERDYDQLFRRGRRDLVGHHGGSASPGQPGNTILVGHNIGHGVNGVFLQLGRLKIGQQVEVVNATGRIFTYQVREVTSVRWTEKDQEQLLQHQDYLSVDGVERLTLVTCGGSNWAPFPDRVYVVAAPAH
jgi:LPXTG-site transpeptidase (sortase) family protein